MAFDFEAAVLAPFRMQPGLRRLEPGARQLTPLAPGSKHQREKLAVLSAYPSRAFVSKAGFDPMPALDALSRQAASEHPDAWAWDGRSAQALKLGTAVVQGRAQQLASGSFGLGDEVARCLDSLAPEWRLPGLISLAFEEDFAIVDASDGSVPWLAVALPSHWAPEEKVGLHFAQVHAPVADNTLLIKAADSLIKLVAGPDRWERFVWNVTDQPRLHAHPAHVDARRWAAGRIDTAFFRSERQTFIPLPAPGRGPGRGPSRPQAIFTIRVDVEPLADVITSRERAAALHDAVASMSDAVLAYRGLTPVRDALLAWLNQRAVR